MEILNGKTYSEYYNCLMNVSQNTMTRMVNSMNNEIVLSYVAENYVCGQVRKAGLLLSSNWWTCILKKDFNKEDFAFHFCYEPTSLDFAFGKELEVGGYHVVHICVDMVENSIVFLYNNKRYTIEEFISLFKLEINDNSKENKDYSNERNSLVLDSLSFLRTTMDNPLYIAEVFICNMFLNKYFLYTVNFDCVWGNKTSNGLQFCIGEVKVKSKNKENAFLMNLGEKLRFEKIIKSTNISVVAICLLSERENRDNVYSTIINGKDYPLLALKLDKSNFVCLLSENKGNVSELTKSYGNNGKGKTSVVSIPFSQFSYIMSFDELGMNYSYSTRINRCLERNSFAAPLIIDHTNIGIMRKYFSIFATLYELREQGFVFDFDTLIKNIPLNGVINLNGVNVLVKFIESNRGFNIRMEEKDLDLCKNHNIQYILVVRNHFENLSKWNISTRNSSKNILCIGNSNEKYVDIIGYIPFSLFEELCVKLPKGTYDNQINIWKAIDKKEPNYGKSGQKKLENDLYVLEFESTPDKPQYVQFDLYPFLHSKSNELLHSLFDNNFPPHILR